MIFERLLQKRPEAHGSRNNPSPARQPVAQYDLINSVDSAAHITAIGDPTQRTYRSGDGVLSVLLAVAAYKVMPTEIQTATPMLPALLTFTPDGVDANQGLVASLSYRFEIERDQAYVWTTHNEYAIRIEALGHLFSAYVQTNAPKRITTGQVKRPVIAMIVPATSNGVESDKMFTLPLLRGLLPSLYATAEPQFTYIVYLAVNHQVRCLHHYHDDDEHNRV